MHEEAKGYSRFLTMAWKKRTWISMGSLIVDNQLRHRSARNCSHHDACEKKKGSLAKYSDFQTNMVKTALTQPLTKFIWTAENLPQCHNNIFCRRRDAHMNYNLKSKMAINVMQTKKRSSDSSSRAERSVMQSKQMYMD